MSKNEEKQENPKEEKKEKPSFGQLITEISKAKLPKKDKKKK